MKRVFNFYAGPATLPVSILEEAAKELTNYNNTGMSVMELSHRSKAYDEIHTETINNIKSLLKVPDNYDILLLQGGASSQFYMIPMNLLEEGDEADYINTGAWTEKAIKEMKILGKKANIIASSKETNFDRIPTNLSFTKNAKYVYIASNNTIHGTEYKELPDTKGIPLVIDASSDIFSTPIDWTNVGIIFAGAQKNAGPSGVTIVIIRKDLIKENEHLPTMLRYSTHSAKNSLFNTPPTFAIYMVGLNLKWLKSLGGIEGIQKINQEKANYIYNAIDNSNGFYVGHAQKDSRSLMNISFNLSSKELEEKFVSEATEAGFIGVKGHRSVGGIRTSVYNAMPVEGCKKIAEFMEEFQKKNS